MTWYSSTQLWAEVSGRRVATSAARVIILAKADMAELVVADEVMLVMCGVAEELWVEEVLLLSMGICADSAILVKRVCLVRS